MSSRTYAKVCTVAVTLWVLALVFVQPFSELIEQVILLFLSTNAR